jgi:transcriptional regulator GlxA family with amidase domain
MTRAITFLLFPGFQILDATGPIAAFEMANRYAPGSYALRLRASRSGPVSSSSGVPLIAEGLAPRAGVDTLLVVGGEGVRAAATDKRLLAYVARTPARRVVSVCSGAYVLAAAGLLDGLRATTHWIVCADFAARFPKVKLESDRIFIKQGRIWTSAGVTAGIDLALALIAEDLGEAVARRVAQRLVVYYRRPGGQSQFSALLELGGSDKRFDTLLAWAGEHLKERLDVERLAERAGMSPRNFARAFVAEAGTTPARAIERLRLQAARARLESGRESVEAVARAVGFGSPERMRRAFTRAFGHSPKVFRALAAA